MVIAIWATLVWVAFFNPVIGEFSKAVDHNLWPDRSHIVLAVLQGLAAIGTTTIAFLNTSYARYVANQNPIISEPPAKTIETK